MINKLRVALVHDQLREFGGAERVLIALKKIFPKADIYTIVYQPEKLGSFKKDFNLWSIKISWFGKIPFVRNFYSPFRFLTPLIWEYFNFSSYDLVISSSGSWMAKGIKTKKPTIHISYIHHPPRYLYGYETAIDWQRYLPVKIYGHIVNHYLRIWDYISTQRPDYLIANSQETKKRIIKFYRRNATVIYPPVNIPPKIIIPNDISKKNFFLTVSRLTRAKHIDLLVTTANKMGIRLKIIGSGRDENYLKKIAGPTVEFFSNLPDEELSQLYLQARAFLFAAKDEEFGIAPVEALGWGLPVIAYHSGGVPEYLKNKVNGFLFEKLTVESLVSTINQFNQLTLTEYKKMVKQARITAERFSFVNFRNKILKFIAKALKNTL